MFAGEEADQQLVERVQKGDKRAFDILVLKYQHRIHALVSRFVRDPDEVQDVVQESFIKAYRALPGFRGESAFFTWLYRIAINTAKNYLVSRSRRPPGSDLDIDDAEYFENASALRDIAGPEGLLMTEQLRQAIDVAIRRLPEDLRTALTLREFDGLSYEEIAEVMRCPVGTVRSRIFRARESVDSEILPFVQGN
jgi:RNA polymerase sigma-70 factor, ECF subfamily